MVDQVQGDVPVQLTLKQVDGIVSTLYNLQASQFEIMTYVIEMTEKFSSLGSPVDGPYKIKNTLVIMQDNLEKLHELATFLGVRGDAKRD